MTAHAKDALRCSSIAEILNFSLAVPAAKASRTECLIPRKDSQVLNLIATCAAAVCTVVADEGAIAQE